MTVMDEILFFLFLAVMLPMVIAVVAELGGWRELARHYREPPGKERIPVRSFRMASVDLRTTWLRSSAMYGSCVIVQIAAEGVHLRTWLRFRHPPLFIPWSQVERTETGRTFLRHTTTLHVRGVRTRIRVYGAPRRAVEDAWRQRAARPARPVLV